ncbi:hypothetical protein Psal006b_03133 [Piscirickettsia salmonis]|uniref:Dual specificity phosphatase, catalytic domain protein n=1 Tax=Piscirickettsia salmonis TaxID=1238 RepID=A0AAC8ZN52_PISSA|nr:dual specificity phosphatase, catalytic domain protein [Piscirickettsia salmonis]QGO00096.1 hypothetical protein Psal006b_03133 [Piscirickettsia salmonis]QGO03746.1 hypothetical protein Psal008_03163 [Piscirickettsia salmonis]QGO14371.1 hypothetical protein Psal010b_03125 [Piscirickettsia salmonis]QGO21472.1 hypothetical protein Psal013_03168 [Piscirickettsia salmonis]
MIECSVFSILGIALPNIITIIVAFVPMFFKIWERKAKSIAASHGVLSTG